MQRAVAPDDALLYCAGLDLVAMASERPDEIEPIAVRRREVEGFDGHS